MDDRKTIILCFDGTTNQFGSHNSNIARLYSMLSKNDPRKQATYYQVGIGQYYEPGSVYQIFEPIAQVVDWLFAWSLSQHIIDGYRYLVQNWKEGDKVLIFGFSRGSYVARGVAGMVQKVGLVAKDNDQTLTLAYRLYERVGPEADRLANSFKLTFSRTVPIDFVGVFDTVASIGLVLQPALPFTNTNRDIAIFRHAVSLDEHRSRFFVNLYNPVPPTPGISLDPRTFGLITFSIPQAIVSIISTVWYYLRNPADLLTWIAGLPSFVQAPSRTIRAPYGKDTDVKEFWFAGCHEDVGGSAVQNTVEDSLANITLRWMVSEIFGAKLEIPVMWRAGVLEGLFGKDPEKSRELDSRDAASKIHDPLGMFPFLLVWLGLEFLLDSRLYEGLKGSWLSQWGINFGRGRLIQVHNSSEHIIFHDTVRERMEKSGYRPNAVYNPAEVQYQPTNFPTVETIQSQRFGD